MTRKASRLDRNAWFFSKPFAYCVFLNWWRRLNWWNHKHVIAMMKCSENLQSFWKIAFYFALSCIFIYWYDKSYFIFRSAFYCTMLFIYFFICLFVCQFLIFHTHNTVPPPPPFSNIFIGTINATIVLYLFLLSIFVNKIHFIQI